MKGVEVARIGRGEPGYPERIVRALGDDAPPHMSVIGDADLVRTPMLALFCSIRCPGNLILGAYDAAVALREAGVPVVAGFHSPMEQECLRLLLRGIQPVVVAPARDITRMRVPSEWRGHIERGRLAVVSWFGERERRATVEQAQTRNRAVAALAEAVLVVHAAAGGKTEALCREIVGWGKRLYALDDAQNAGVMALGARAVRAGDAPRVWET